MNVLVQMAKLSIDYISHIEKYSVCDKSGDLFIERTILFQGADGPEARRSGLSIPPATSGVDTYSRV